jgi:hypothetical protein
MERIIKGRVYDQAGTGSPIFQALVTLSPSATSTSKPAGENAGTNLQNLIQTFTNENGEYLFSEELPNNQYEINVHAFDVPSQRYPIPAGEAPVEHNIPLNLGIHIRTSPSDAGYSTGPVIAKVGRSILANLDSNVLQSILRIQWDSSSGVAITPISNTDVPIEVLVGFSASGEFYLTAVVTAREQHFDSQAKLEKQAKVMTRFTGSVAQPDVNMIAGKVGVALQRASVQPTLDQALWVAIRNRTRAISFHRYSEFIDRIMCDEDSEISNEPRLKRQILELGTQMRGVGAYQLLKTATEVFLLMECGVKKHGPSLTLYEHLYDAEREEARLGEFLSFEEISNKLKHYLGRAQQLPYITRVVEAAFPEYLGRGVFCDRVVSARINEPPLIELIWSYWHEEGMLVQTMNAVNRRFQNVRAPGDRDPLMHLEIDPLRRVGNLLWGQIQDDLNVLSVKRRAYEYAHHYGLTIYGRAAAEIRPADNRSKFLEAFHNLLNLTSVFFKEDNDTTVIADGYPLLNALKEVHLVLAQGAHNQFGDLPWTARAEMLAMEWILSRPEIREFLQSRIMVPYKEPWMAQVDTMKSVQGWTDVTVTHFRDLGFYGEQILLSVRFGDWIGINDEDSAKNWARYWRPEIQGYLHAYRAATGVDLTNTDAVDATVPAVHLQKRLSLQQRMR